MAERIGQGVSFDQNNHSSICKVKANITVGEPFNFKPVEVAKVAKYIDKLNIKKATGVDKISNKLIKLAKPAIVSRLIGVINLTVQKSTFPNDLKMLR